MDEQNNVGLVDAEEEDDLDFELEKVQSGNLVQYASEPLTLTIAQLPLALERAATTVLEDLGLDELNERAGQSAFWLVVKSAYGGTADYAATSPVFSSFEFLQSVQILASTVETYANEGVWIEDGITSGDVETVLAFAVEDGEPLMIVITVTSNNF